MRYRILGATEAHDDRGVPVPVGGPRLRALLAALALRAGRTATAEALIDEVWADAPPHDAHAALQALVGRLRRTLGREAVTSAPGGYRLDTDPGDVDLHRFEQLARQGSEALAGGDAEAAARTLREALALWRGPALADLPDRTAAARPEARRLDVTRTWIEAELRLGRARDVVPELRGLTEAHPYDEPLHAHLIRALRDSGRGADALAGYEHVRRTLAEGLGADPGPELRALHAELLAGTEPSVRRTGTAVQRTRTAARRAGAAVPEPDAPEETPTPQERDPDRAPSDATPPQRSQHAPREAERAERSGNLRPRLTSFVGREPELAAIRSDLQRARLVTLTGPGGSGKTRLAEETAGGHPAPSWLAELAPLDHPEAVPGAVVSALGLRETVLMTSELVTAQDDPTALLIEYCAPRSLLLILDNCEHVIGAAARLAETLLTRCPDLRILATSREPLGVPGESVRPVDPLPEATAHRLFAERAAAVHPGFDPADDPAAVAEICTRLDGLPLAIELAAARLLTPRQIADRLDDRFRLLTSGSRTVLPRQQTLRAVVDWSWDLLDEGERTVLRQVSVFAGDWDLPAAETVCGPDAAVLLGALIDKSLVVAAPVKRRQKGPADAGGMRYRLLETIHEYAAERAVETPELHARARQRHIDHYLALVEEAEPLLRTAAQMPWIDRLEGDLDNIRAALQRTVEDGDEDRASALALGIGWFWWLRNYRKEGAEWIAHILPLGAEPQGPDAEDDPRYWPRMRLRLARLFLVAESGPMEELNSPEVVAEVTRLRDAFARPVPQAASFPGLLWPFTQFVLEGASDRRDAMDLAVEICRKHGGPWEVGVALMFRTHIAVDMSGGMTGVDEDLAELRELSREVGDRWMRAQVCSAAGEAAMARGQFTSAQGEYEEALQLAYEVGAHAEAPFLIARLAEIAYQSGDLDLAERALAEADTEADRYGVADAHAFVRTLAAVFALERGEVVRARQEWRAALEQAARGTPPPQFEASIAALDGRITLKESGPEPALPKLVDGLRSAVRGRCAEAVLATLAESAALTLAGLGVHAPAARILSAATRWRADLPRPAREHAEAEALQQELTTALGPATYEAERSAGTSLTPEDVLMELASAQRSLGTSSQ
ncbi:AfsR/SARP family transcriptional regulator [Streptomyces sp. NPDC002851]